MVKLLLVQIRKLFARADAKWILAVFAVLPIAIALLISMESGIVQIGASVFSAMGYGSVLVGLLNSLLLIAVTLALTTTSLVSKEIDTSLDCMYVTKVKSRGHILLSKTVAMDLLTLAIFATLVISAICGWFIFLRGSEFGSDIFFSTDRDEGFTLVYAIVGSMFEMFVMTRIYILFSLLFKYGKAIIFNFVTIVLFKLLTNIKILRDWIPSYIGSGVQLAPYSGRELFVQGYTALGILAAYALVLSIVNYCIYRKMDLAR